MNMRRFNHVFCNGIKYYRDRGLQCFIIRCFEKLGFSGELKQDDPRRLYNSELYNNIHIFSKYFHGEFEDWERELQKNCRIAVQCHIFYIDLIEELKDKLNNIPYAYDLYVTTDSEEKAQYICEYLNPYIKAQHVDLQVRTNKGRDVIPFLQQMRPVFSYYDYICHLHTKKTTHKKLGNFWRQILYNALLGSVGQVRQIFTVFYKHQEIGLLFPHICGYAELDRLTIDWAYEKPWGMILWQRMGFKNDKLPQKINFPAGNMMWLRTKALEQLISLTIYPNEIPPEKGQTMGTIMHAIERLWPYVARENGYEFMQIELQDGSWLRGRWKIFKGILRKKYIDKGKYYINLGVNYLRYGKIQYKDINRKAGNYAVENALHMIKDSSYWNKEWYLNHYPDVLQANIDPVLDYFINGIIGRRNPGPDFDSAEYLDLNPDVKEAFVNPLLHHEQSGNNIDT